MSKGEKIYLVWQDGEDENYYNQYESLEDAVSSEEEPVEVFEADLKSLGQFRMQTKVVKIPKGNK